MHDEVGLGLILRTFESVFPATEIFLLPPAQAVMVGSPCPLAARERPSRDELEAIGVAKTIRSLFVQDADDLGALWIMNGREIRDVVGDGPINSWNRSPLEFHNYRQKLLEAGDWSRPLGMVFGPRVDDPRGASEFSRSPNYDSMYRINLAALRFMQGEIARAEASLRAVLANDPEHVLARAVLVALGLEKRGELELRRAAGARGD